MTRVLFDVNVVLDVLLDRGPHAQGSAAVWAAAETGAVQGLLAAHAVTTIHYLVRKETGNAEAKRIVSAILRVFGVAPVNREVIEVALSLPGSDFEDAVTASAAQFAGCAFIVSRDPKGFRGSPVRCLTTEAALPLFKAK